MIEEMKDRRVDGSQKVTVGRPTWAEQRRGSVFVGRIRLQ